MLSKLCAITATILVAGIALAGPATAEGSGQPVGGFHRFRTEVLHGADNTPSTCGSLSWQDVGVNGDDSPIDSNDRALVAQVCDGDYSDAYTTASLALNTPLADVKNISFDYRTATITGAGQVYIGIVLSSGEVLYADPTYCSKPIGVSSTWSRADFTGTTGLGECTIYDNTGTPWTSDGTQSALDVYALAHPDANVSYTFIGFFDYPGTDPHTYVVDRVALGSHKLYNYSNTRAFACQNSEARC